MLIEGADLAKNAKSQAKSLWCNLTEDLKFFLPQLTFSLSLLSSLSYLT